MPRDASGNYVRPTNSFSNPVTLTVINSTDADALFDDFESAMNMSGIKTPAYLVTSASPALPNQYVFTAGAGVFASASANIYTLKVGAGTGITINANDVQLSAINPVTILANTSAGTAVPVGTTLSAIIDTSIASGNIQGSILYRSTASGWAALPPATAGTFLRSGGASANVSWADAIAQINSGQVLANVGATTATPVGTSLSALIDAGIASANVQGSILYRSTAGSWAALPPATAGSFLRTAGASANPSWVAIPGGGDMLAANNLSDLANFASAQVNLGVGIGMPGGRLSISSAIPVLTATTSASSVYYSPYIHNKVPIYDGAIWKMLPIYVNTIECSAGDATKSPAVMSANENYDLFVWNDSGAVRLSRGPKWTSSTVRASDITRVDGVYVNASNITNVASANKATYVGTIRTNATNRIEWTFGTVAANGGAGVLGVFNAYNRLQVASFCGDSTDAWAYAAVIWRPANNSETMRHSFVVGLSEDRLFAMYSALATATTNAASQAAATGVGLDATANFTGSTGMMYNANAGATISPAMAHLVATPAIGFHYVQAIELGATASAMFFIGDNGVPTNYQSGLTFIYRM